MNILEHKYMLTALTNYPRYLFLVTFLTFREAYGDIKCVRDLEEGPNV